MENNNTEEIREGNRIIFEFMYPDQAHNSKTACLLGCPGKWMVQYETNWNELMPVVEKMEEMGYFLTSDPCSHTLIEYSTGTECVVVETQFDINRTKIKELYIIVVEFIKWYNQHGK